MKRAASLACISFALTACSQAVPIGDLVQSPHLYDGDIVTVTGVVDGQIAILGIGGYLLTDAGHGILILSDRGVPSVDDKVTVSGRFIQALSIAGIEYSVVVQAETVLFRTILSFKGGSKP